jgi:hypothetical protein
MNDSFKQFDSQFEYYVLAWSFDGDVAEVVDLEHEGDHLVGGLDRLDFEQKIFDRRPSREVARKDDTRPRKVCLTFRAFLSQHFKPKF